MAEPETLCACGSGEFYGDCCEPFHAGHMEAPTAVALVRSRYSAFVYGKINYLVETTFPASRTPDLENRCRATCESISWIGLEVVSASQGGPSDKVGKVEFKVGYSEGRRIKVYREYSRFRRKRGKWYYVDDVLAGS